MNSIPRYSKLEIERRWLVDNEISSKLENLNFHLIEDLYIKGSRIRLRKMTEPDGSIAFKLGKKYGKQNLISEPTTSIYLSPEEYQEFQNLPGFHVKKKRYPLFGGSLDLYLDPNPGLMIYEVEFENEADAKRYTPPDSSWKEVTCKPNFSGHKLAINPNV